MKKCISTETITTQRDTIPSNLQSEVVNYSLWMRREGFSPTTIQFRSKTVRRMAQQLGTLLDGDAVKEWVANLPICGGSKLAMFKAYACYAKFKGVTFQVPKVQDVEAPLPFIPLENELDAPIAGAGKKLSAFLLLLKEVGCRAEEALRIEWTDLDLEAGTVNIRAEKTSRNRQAKLSQKLMAMLLKLPRRNRHVFSCPTGANKLSTLASNLYAVRVRQSRKLEDPRLLRIHFHTFRLWKATSTYHKTKDIIYTQKVLGHRCIDSTMRHTQLVSWENESGFHCRTAKDSSEAKELVEAGWEYVATAPKPEKVMVFRRRQ